VRKIVENLEILVSYRAPTLGDAFMVVAAIAGAWPTLTRAEKRKVRLSALSYSGLIDMRRCRRTGFKVGLYDSVAQGIERQTKDEMANSEFSADYDRGRWQLKYTVVCEEHGTCVCVPSISNGRTLMAFPSFCEECAEVLKDSA
jgi:hypothetical protein